MRAVYAGQSRSRIEGMTLRERFSFKYSFVYRAWGNTRTTPVGQAVRLAGVFGGNGPGRGLRERFSPLESFAYQEQGNTRTTFVQLFVRVSSAMRYANGFSTWSLGQAGSVAHAGGSHRLSCGVFSPKNSGKCTIPDPRAKNAAFPGMKRGFCTIPRVLAAPFSGVDAPFAHSTHQHAEETPGQGLAGTSE